MSHKHLPLPPAAAQNNPLARGIPPESCSLLQPQQLHSSAWFHSSYPKSLNSTGTPQDPVYILLNFSAAEEKMGSPRACGFAHSPTPRNPDLAVQGQVLQSTMMGAHLIQTFAEMHFWCSEKASFPRSLACRDHPYWEYIGREGRREAGVAGRPLVWSFYLLLSFSPWTLKADICVGKEQRNGSFLLFLP